MPYPYGIVGTVALCDAVAGWIPFPWFDQIATASSVSAATTRSSVGSSTPEFVLAVAEVLHEGVPETDLPARVTLDPGHATIPSAGPPVEARPWSPPRR